MSEEKKLSRRSRTILAMDALLMDSGNDLSRISRQDIATKAANWTTDSIDMFQEDETDQSYEDYYKIIESLINIVGAMRHNQGGEE